jgi:endoglucanase
VRLPLSYKFWINNDDVYDINEEALKNIDQAVEFGDKYNIHVNLNFHKAPGYNVSNYIIEPYSLWKDDEAIKAFCFHWELMAKRYKGIDSKR